MSIISKVICDNCGTPINKPENGFAFTGNVLAAPVDPKTGAYDPNAKGGIIGDIKDTPLYYCKTCVCSLLDLGKYATPQLR